MYGKFGKHYTLDARRLLKLGVVLLMAMASLLPSAGQPTVQAAVNTVAPGTYVFDFEGLTIGGSLTEYTIGDLTMKISVTGGTGDAVIFDSANPTCGDDDLGTPNEDFGGPGIGTGGEATGAGPNQNPLGNVLIIQEDSGTCTPNDNGGGGTITFEFVQTSDKNTPVEVTVQFFDLLDIDANESGGLSVQFFNGATEILPGLTSVGPGNNSYEQFILNRPGVTEIVTTMGGSGAIPSVQVAVDETTAALGNYVWCDVNEDGIQNDGPENGKNGITVNLLDGNGNPVVDGNNAPITTTTADGPDNAPGYYAFTDLPVGNYIIEFDDDGNGFTEPRQGDVRSADSDADKTTGRSGVVTLIAGADDPTIDAGLLCGGGTLPVTLGYFLAEQNGDSVNFTWQTATESGVAGFNLLAESDGQLIQLNTELIPSKVIDSVEPTGYSYEATSTATVFYIEEIEISGKTDRIGPFALGTSSGVHSGFDAQSTSVIWLPMITR